MATKSPKFTRPFSIGYAYAQTQHYRDAVAAAAQDDPFANLPEVEEEPAPAAPVRAQGQFQDLATTAQVRYAMSLATKKLGLTTAEELESAERTFKAMGKREISHRIDNLKAAPDAPKAPAAATPAVTEGMYQDPTTGDIYKVQVAHHGSGNLYAKKLVKLEVPRVKRGKEHSHDFEYTPGAIRLIQPSWKMSKEQAQAWGRLYGACCKCGTILTDEESIAAGIGPVCGGSW